MKGWKHNYWDIEWLSGKHKTSIPALAFAVAISFFIWRSKSFSNLRRLLASDRWYLQS
jgi:hypothetical protein